MQQSKSIDRTAHAHDPKMPYFDDSKDKMDSYLSRFEKYATANKWDPSLWAAYLSALLQVRASLRCIWQVISLGRGQL